MSEETQQAPGQQENPGQQAGGSSGYTAPVGYVEQARFNGLVQKVEQLTLAARELNAQLEARSSEIEQLKAQLSIKDTEKQVAVGERDTRLNSTLTELSQLQSKVKDLEGLKLKVEVANELKRPDLLKLAERIPALEDKEALKIIMQDFANFADEAVKAREEQLLAGYTPGGGPGATEPSAPSSPDAWLAKINGLTLGTPERAKAMNDYGDWLEKQNQRK